MFSSIDDANYAQRIRDLHKELERTVQQARDKGLKVNFSADYAGTFSGPMTVRIWRDQKPIEY